MRGRPNICLVKNELNITEMTNLSENNLAITNVGTLRGIVMQTVALLAKHC